MYTKVDISKVFEEDYPGDVIVLQSLLNETKLKLANYQAHGAGWRRLENAAEHQVKLLTRLIREWNAKTPV